MQAIALPRQAGIYVRSVRKQQGLSQRELARRAGVSERLVLSLELGDTPGIQFDKLLSILDALDMHLFVDCEPTPDPVPKVADASKAANGPCPPRELPGQTREEARPHSTKTVDYESLYNELVKAAAKDSES